jgi:hypothetical protein
MSYHLLQKLTAYKAKLEQLRHQASFLQGTFRPIYSTPYGNLFMQTDAGPHCSSLHQWHGVHTDIP